MRAWQRWLGVALAVATGAGPVVAQEAAAGDAKPASPFLTSLEQGFARAKAERKLLFVDLHHPL